MSTRKRSRPSKEPWRANYVKTPAKPKPVRKPWRERRDEASREEQERLKRFQEAVKIIAKGLQGKTWSQQMEYIQQWAKEDVPMLEMGLMGIGEIVFKTFGAPTVVVKSDLHPLERVFPRRKQPNRRRVVVRSYQ